MFSTDCLPVARAKIVTIFKEIRQHLDRVSKPKFMSTTRRGWTPVPSVCNPEEKMASLTQHSGWDTESESNCEETSDKPHMRNAQSKNKWEVREGKKRGVKECGFQKRQYY